MPNNNYTSTANTSWTVPAGITEITVEIWGAGGGGGGSNINTTAGGSGGGGGGAYVRLAITGLVPGNIHGLNVGAGGAGGPAGNNNGSPGGTSNFYNNSGGNTAIIVGANAGAGGINAANTGNKAGIGGAANGTVGTSYKGGNGANNGGSRIGGGAGAGAGNANAGADTSVQTGSTGANGGGSGGNGGSRNANGNQYQTVSGAGGGGAGQSNGTARAGGLGGNGRVYITWADVLVVQDAYSTSQVDPVTLTLAAIDLVVQDAYSTTQVDDVVLPSTGQTLSPSFDVTDGNWTNESGSAVDLFESLNEESPSDTDYIQSEYSPTASPVVVGLESGIDPASSSGHVLRYRLEKYPVGSVTLSMTVQLRQGYTNEGSPGTLIAEWTDSDLSDTMAMVQRTLTTGQADSITNYASLFIRMVAN
jgi:hypothetical protein